MKWEYKVVEVDKFKSLKEPTELQQEFNNYGSDGWELVGVLQREQDGKGWMPKLSEDVVTFKRLIQK